MSYIKQFSIYIIMGLVGMVYAGVSDPLLDLKTQRGFETGDIVYKLVIDINGDNKPDVLFSYKTDYDRAIANNEPPPWDIYLADPTGSTYTASTGTDFNDGNGVGPGYVRIDLDKMFVGEITQIGKSGIVTVQTDYPKNGPASSSIYAYTVESGHIKQTELVEFSPSITNVVYNQYLSNAHRTKIQAQQVTIP